MEMRFQVENLMYVMMFYDKEVLNKWSIRGKEVSLEITDELLEGLCSWKAKRPWEVENPEWSLEPKELDPNFNYEEPLCRDEYLTVAEYVETIGEETGWSCGAPDYGWTMGKVKRSWEETPRDWHLRWVKELMKEIKWRWKSVGSFYDPDVYVIADLSPIKARLKFGGKLNPKYWLESCIEAPSGTKVPRG